MTDRTVLIQYNRPSMASIPTRCRQTPCKVLEINYWQFGQGWPTGYNEWQPTDPEGEFVFMDETALGKATNPAQYLYLKEIARIGVAQYELVFLEYVVPEGYWELRRHRKPAPPVTDFPCSEVVLPFQVTKGDIPVFLDYYQKLIDKGQIVLPLKL